MITLQVIQDGKVLFRSEKRWLLPLFDLEDYITRHPVEMPLVEVHDKVIGKAAALLIVRIGAGSAHADVISKLARAVFDQASIPYIFSTLVEKIDCHTEEILSEVDDPDTAYHILRKCAGRDTE